MSPTTDRAPVGRLSTIVLDCPDPRALAGFYGALLGWAVDDSATEEDWVELDTGGAIGLAFQQVSAYRPPQWPGQDHPQQAHLDIRVGDLDEGSARSSPWVPRDTRPSPAGRSASSSTRPAIRSAWCGETPRYVAALTAT